MHCIRSTYLQGTTITSNFSKYTCICCPSKFHWFWIYFSINIQSISFVISCWKYKNLLFLLQCNVFCIWKVACFHSPRKMSGASLSPCLQQYILFTMLQYLVCHIWIWSKRAFKKKLISLTRSHAPCSNFFVIFQQKEHSR